MLGLLALAWNTTITKPQELNSFEDFLVPSACAAASLLNVGQYNFENNCPFSVYWTIWCLSTSCRINTKIILQPGEEKQRDYLGLTIQGPYRE